MFHDVLNPAGQTPAVETQVVEQFSAQRLLLENIRNPQVQHLELTGLRGPGRPFKDSRTEPSSQAVLLHLHHKAMAVPDGTQQDLVERFDETHVHHLGGQTRLGQDTGRIK